ncbi:hypothetical protein C6I21_08940 [Alkalicoccus urumqiensis]|uniref:Uncharacterized protein n=1 Tax=Alkalicoccus urumqiensis TaxID=1548213 RepID=A0A2P6MH88_ALKUR|nr:hypothetical protein C6I21_08940 [Alkalicoccus urumqiensis]
MAQWKKYYISSSSSSSSSFIMSSSSSSSSSSFIMSSSSSSSSAPAAGSFSTFVVSFVAGSLPVFPVPSFSPPPQPASTPAARTVDSAEICSVFFMKNSSSNNACWEDYCREQDM